MPYMDGMGMENWWFGDSNRDTPKKPNPFHFRGSTHQPAKPPSQTITVAEHQNPEKKIIRDFHSGNSRIHTSISKSG